MTWRNSLVHEYMIDPHLFLEALHAASQACQLFFGIVHTVEAEVRRLGVSPAP